MSRLIGSAYEHDFASGGAEALAALASKKYDLVLLDLLMPGMDGFMTLAEIRKVNPALPILVITADIQASTKKRVLETGCAGVLNKPPKREELLSRIAELLGDAG